MKFISFWFDKPGTQYYHDAYLRLKTQMDYFGFSYDFENIKFSKKTYEQICLHKPTFILDRLSKIDDSVCWIDIDCQFVQRFNPDIFTGDMCLGKRDTEELAPHSAIVYCNNTPNTKQFIQLWKNRCDSVKDDITYAGGDHSQLILTFQNNPISDMSINQIDNLCSTYTNALIHIGISDGGKEAENIKRMVI